MNEPCFYRVSVKAIAVDTTGRFLIARESDNRWELLGGGLEHTEDPQAGLIRELREEAGLETAWVSPTPKYFITCPRDGHASFVANVIYQVKFKDLAFTPSDECQELRFVSIDEARSLELFPNVEALLNVYDPGLHIS